jgi:hypothetical protein
MQNISKIIQNLLPGYKLYLKVDSLSCYVITAPVREESIVNLEEAMNPHSSL